MQPPAILCTHFLQTCSHPIPNTASRNTENTSQLHSCQMGKPWSRWPFLLY